MQKAKIKVIEKYLASLPDSASEQVVAFVSYLNYMKNINSEYPYPDEYAVIEQYRQKKDKLFSWDFRVTDTRKSIFKIPHTRHA